MRPFHASRIMSEGNDTLLDIDTAAPAETTPLLEVSAVSVSFRSSPRVPPTPALQSVSFTIPEHGSLAVAGPSGCGKSTLIRVIAGLQRHDTGSILWRGVPIGELPIRERLRQKIRIQMVFQDPNGSLDPRRSIGQSIRDAVRTFSVEPDFSDHQLGDALESVGLPRNWVHRYPHQLSGGQRQRVCIARAVACRPELLLCDEPVSALDVTTQGRILRLLNDLRSRLGFSILFVGHDLAVLQIVADQILFLETGRVAEIGPTLPTLTNPRSPIARSLLKASG